MPRAPLSIPNIGMFWFVRVDQMCGLDGADSTACLDVCSGYEALLPEVDDFTYRYYTVRAENSCYY